MKKLTMILTIILSLCFFQGFAFSQNNSFKIREVKPYFHHSPIADYMFFLLFRQDFLDQFDMKNTFDFSEIPYFKISPPNYYHDYPSHLHFCETIIIKNIKEYKYLYNLIEETKDLADKQKVIEIVKLGEKKYPEFLKFWKEKIEPYELKLLDNWKKEWKNCKPIEKLQKIERLEYPYDEIHNCVCVFHPSGSMHKNYIFGIIIILKNGLIMPTLANLIGHESTHTMLGGIEGGPYDWTKTEVGKKVVKKYGVYNVEEATCFVMQERLIVECGWHEEKYMRKGEYYGPLYSYCYTCMQSKWDEYINNPEKYPTIIDLMLECRKEPYIGITVASITQAVAKKLGIDYNPKTIIVYKVIQNSPAEKVGIKKYDIILKMDDIKIENKQEFESEIAKHQIGDKVRLTVLRGKEEIEFDIVVEGKI